MSSPVSAPGPSYVSTAPRRSTTQQCRGSRHSISSHHSYGCSPPARLSDYFRGDTPPPYGSISPLGSNPTRTAKAEGTTGINRIGRRVKSEPCAVIHHGHDDDFLTKLATIKLLTGCTAGEAGKVGTRRTFCGNGCHGIAWASEDLCPNPMAKNHTSSLAISQHNRVALHSDTDGNTSLDSTDGVRTRARRCSTSTTPLFFREEVSSEDLERTPRSIGDALHQDNYSTGFFNKRLCTSEASRKEQALTAEDTVDAERPYQHHKNPGEGAAKNTWRGILGTLRSLQPQHKDRSGQSAAMIDPLDPSGTTDYEQGQQSSQRRPPEDRSNTAMPQSLRDRISKRLQARSLSSRYGDFTFDSSPRPRRRNDRYSSVYISSAESTPLLNAPVPNQGQVPADAKSQLASWRSAIDPLATASLMLATAELDRLANRQT
jgi:hypothetical protein